MSTKHPNTPTPSTRKKKPARRKAKPPTRRKPGPAYSLRRYEYSLVREATDIEFQTAICNPNDALYFLSKEMAPLDREHMYAIHLDGQNQVIGFELVTKGSQTRCDVSPREIFRGALAAGAVSIVLVHNHPAGSLDPSPEDCPFNTTEKRARFRV